MNMQEEGFIKVVGKQNEKIGCEELPPQWILNNNGYNSLSAAISTYHGGFPRFRELLNQHLGRSSDKNQLETLLESYIENGRID